MTPPCKLEVTTFKNHGPKLCLCSGTFQRLDFALCVRSGSGEGGSEEGVMCVSVFQCFKMCLSPGRCLLNAHGIVVDRSVGIHLCSSIEGDEMIQ